ncbi:MAG: thymidylate synthase complementing protein ThyX [uncultured bacterium]|nr:MAG: thymidylate synthase complementing protein ThyX [uncultured bacterium]KKP67597.1 MAG: Thymidylate synthase complementing protein ThyX [Candidatus Moranbacteria bacterium GW2011_GWE2_35_164]KKP68694.1 MAG: Thymidylate synthase complementing protein ThyX [Candidatus Moranbacteria bacterium GW2011_GWE1_35_17]KKP82768.1 MAG: Thymidylate synthase complementing protein ThyX [Candidatus Moranbacteria bacterium GW2011_GWF2_35_54]KKP83950.1 MAG: Thymidylate synthase complementing protein ThyX [C
MIKLYDKAIVIPPSFEILSDELSLAQRIELCGKVCYKAEDNITESSAIGFIEKMVKHKHNSTLEMGVASLKVNYLTIGGRWFFDEFYQTIPKYLVVDALGSGELLVTGSVRAFREIAIKYPNCEVVGAMAYTLASRHPYFFKDIDVYESKFVKAEKVSLEKIDQLEPELKARHRFVAVRFVVNRAVTHELVRHRPCALLQESQRYCRYSLGKFGSRVTFIKPIFFKEGSEAYALWEQSVLRAEADYLALLEMKDTNGDKYTAQAARTVLPNSCKTELIIYTSLEHWHHLFHMRAINPAAEPSMREIMIPVHAEFIRRFPNQNFDKPRRMPEGWVQK